jgi:DNA-binding transcriptional ArsR family regulator
MEDPVKVEIPVLPEDVPITMPELPTEKTIDTLGQFRAITDPVRTRILNIVQLRPATAKQIADRLKASPGSIGHHLHVLEDAGLVQVSARRLVHGIVANYYTRTARIFLYQLPKELSGNDQLVVDISAKAVAELAEARRLNPEAMSMEGFPHARLTPERVEYYQQRFNQLLDELLHEPADGPGDVYGVLYAMFKSPPYLQNDPALNSDSQPKGK